ncbi:MAG: GFA family protein [Deltaproteobacteria bacterium]|nr:GFA family protein [Deltaproteobacteria bacterium]
MPVPFEGGCRCGAIRYRCTAEPAAFVHCYCRDCQYASGGASSSVLVVMQESVSVEGSPASFSVAADSGTMVSRLFCGQCGTPLFARNAATTSLLGIKVATLDDPSWLQPSAHIWTDSAPPWVGFHDDLAKFAKNFGAG